MDYLVKQVQRREVLWMKIVLNWLMLIVVVFIKWNISNEYLLPRLEEKHWTSRAACCWPQKLINYVFIYLIKLEMTIQSQGVGHCLATLAVAMFVTVQVYILWLVSTGDINYPSKTFIIIVLSIPSSSPSSACTVINQTNIFTNTIVMNATICREIS